MRIRFPWTPVGTIASVLALALAAWLGYTSGTLGSPKLEFGFGAIKGISGGDLRNAGLKDDGPVTYLVMTSNATKAGSHAAFMIPFYLRNQSSRAVRDVVVRLSYPARVAVTFDKITLVDPPGEARLNPEYTKLRTVKTSAEVGATEFQIPVLRPGEAVTLGDMFLLGDPARSADSSTKGTNVKLLGFPERLREQIDLQDIVKVRAFAASSEAGPYTADLTVVWTRGSHGAESIEALGDRITNAAWGPYRLKPGTYFKWPWESKLYKREFFEFLHVPLSKGAVDSGGSLYVQDIERTRMAAFSSSMPPWDYWGPVGP